MAIELKKGERVSLDNTLNNLTIGLGWIQMMEQEMIST